MGINVVLMSDLVKRKSVQAWCNKLRTSSVEGMVMMWLCGRDDVQGVSLVTPVFYNKILTPLAQCTSRWLGAFSKHLCASEIRPFEDAPMIFRALSSTCATSTLSIYRTREPRRETRLEHTSHSLPMTKTRPKLSVKDSKWAPILLFELWTNVLPSEHQACYPWPSSIRSRVHGPTQVGPK